ERVVEVRRNRAIACHRRPKNFFQQWPDEWHRCARMRNLPAHQQQQKKSEQHEAQRRKAILNADDFMVGGKNIGAPETGIVMGVDTVAMIIAAAIRWKLFNGCSHVTSPCPKPSTPAAMANRGWTPETTAAHPPARV